MTKTINNTKRLKSKRSLLVVALPIALLLSVASVVTWSVIENNKTSAESSETQHSIRPEQSVFSFDAAKAPGWRQGPSNKTSMALFSNDQSCFVSIEQKSGAVDAVAESEKTQTNLSHDGYAVSRVDSAHPVITVNSNAVSFELTQYSVSGSGNAGQLYGGQGLGYLTVGDEYLKAQVNCNNTDQLKSAVVALSAFSYKDN